MSDLLPGEALCQCGMRYYYNSREGCPFCGTSCAERVAIGPVPPETPQGVPLVPHHEDCGCDTCWPNDR